MRKLYSSFAKSQVKNCVMHGNRLSLECESYLVCHICLYYVLASLQSKLLWGGGGEGAGAVDGVGLIKESQ